MSRHLILVSHYFSTHHGGVERVAADLARHLSEAHNWTVMWLASDVDPLPSDLPERITLVRAQCWNGVERLFGFPWPIWSLRALRHLWQAIAHANIVHLHDALYFGNAFSWLFARLQGVPVVVTQHVGSIPYSSPVLRLIHQLANRSLGRLVLSTAEKVVFISPAVRDEFASFCSFRSPPAYIPNGVDTNIFFPNGPIAEDQPIIATRAAGKRVFLFVGRFVEKKGLPVLRQLAAMLPDDLWILAGHGEIDPAAWCLPNVRVVRGKTGIELATYYRLADLLVLPSVGEGFPLVVQEAMACGTPAMVGEETAAGCPNAHPLLLVESVGSADTATRWAQRLSALRAQPEQLVARRSAVASFAHAHWSWESTATAYAELLAATLAAPASLDKATR